MSEREQAKCEWCGAEWAQIQWPNGATCAGWVCGSTPVYGRSDACRIRERDNALSTIRAALGLPADTEPRRVAEEAGKLREAERLLGCAHVALALVVKWAERLWQLWGEVEDHKVRKGLLAIAGHLPGYAPDTDGIHAFLREIAKYRNARSAAESARTTEAASEPKQKGTE